VITLPDLSTLGAHPDCHPAHWLSTADASYLLLRANTHRAIDLLALYRLACALGVDIDITSAFGSFASAADVANEIGEVLALRQAASTLPTGT
jgi:hypothetical protein